MNDSYFYIRLEYNQPRFLEIKQLKASELHETVSTSKVCKHGSDEETDDEEDDDDEEDGRTSSKQLVEPLT